MHHHTPVITDFVTAKAPVVKVKQYPRGDYYITVTWGRLRISMTPDEAAMFELELRYASEAVPDA